MWNNSENNENIDILSMFENNNISNKDDADILSMFEVEKKEEQVLYNSENTIIPWWDIIDMDFSKKEEDILENISFQNENILSNEETKEEFIEVKNNKIIDFIKFLTSYLTTSAIIFFILLWALNYNSYIQIAKSYFNKEWLELDKNAMLASVASTNIVKENKKEEDIFEEEKQKEFEINAIEQMNSIKNKTFHSMDRLVDWNWDNDINIDVSITPYENRIVIPKIWKNIPLIDVKARKVQNVKELEDIFMQELTNWIVRYPWSAKPGEKWNSFIFWHSSNFPWIKWDYNDVFALLDNVVFWDEVIAYYWQKKYVYKIKEKKIVKPWDVSVLKRDAEKKEISLMTCWPIWTTLNRMIIIWELVEEK